MVNIEKMTLGDMFRLNFRHYRQRRHQFCNIVIHTSMKSSVPLRMWVLTTPTQWSKCHKVRMKMRALFFVVLEQEKLFVVFYSRLVFFDNNHVPIHNILDTC